MTNADLRGPHDLGEIVGYAYRIYARNFPTMFLLAATTVPLQMLLTVLLRRTDPGSGAQSAATLLLMPVLLVNLLAAGALILAVDAAAGGRKPEFGEALDAAITRYTALLSTFVLAIALTIASLIAFPYFAVRWTFHPQAVMLERKRNWGALDSSSCIVKGRWWRAFGIIVVIAMFAIGPSLIAQVAALGPPIVDGAVTSIVSALVLPLIVTAQTLLYYDLKARKQADVNADRLAAAEPDVPGESP